MPYKPDDISETATVLGVAFVVGAIAQYTKQKVNAHESNKNTGWISLGAGLSAMIIIGLLYEYTNVSAAFLMAISGIAGWAGITVLATLAGLLDGFIIKTAKDKFNVDPTREGVDNGNTSTTSTTTEKPGPGQ